MAAAAARGGRGGAHFCFFRGALRVAEGVQRAQGCGQAARRRRPAPALRRRLSRAGAPATARFRAFQVGWPGTKGETAPRETPVRSAALQPRRPWCTAQPGLSASATSFPLRSARMAASRLSPPLGPHCHPAPRLPPPVASAPGPCPCPARRHGEGGPRQVRRLQRALLTASVFFISSAFFLSSVDEVGPVGWAARCGVHCSVFSVGRTRNAFSVPLCGRANAGNALQQPQPHRGVVCMRRRTLPTARVCQQALNPSQSSLTSDSHRTEPQLFTGESRNYATKKHAHRTGRVEQHASRAPVTDHPNDFDRGRRLARVATGRPPLARARLRRARRGPPRPHTPTTPRPHPRACW